MFCGRFFLFLAAAALVAAEESARFVEESAGTRGLGGHGGGNGPTIVINGAGGYGGQYPYTSSGYGGPTMQVMHNRIPSTRVASLDTRSAPIAVVERPVLIAPASRPVCTASACGPSVMAAPAMVVEREAVTQIVREKTCPAGMDLGRDGMCVGLDICPVTYTCPPNTVQSHDGRCVIHQRPLIECNYGETLRGDRCVSSEIMPAELTCRDPRFVLDSGANVCVQTIEVAPRCPPGFQFEGMGGECVQRVPSQPSCPQGFTLSVATRECVRTITDSPQTVCPEGAYQRPGSDVCVITRQDPPRCPPRFNFDSQQGVCVQPIPKIPVECPYGHSRVGSQCERTEREAAEFTCPPGYELGYDNVCVQSIEVPPVCPPGFVHSSSAPGQCEKCVKEQPQCPPGTRQAGFGSALRCESEVERPSKECCAPGFNLEGGVCRRLEITAPTLSCSDNCYTVTEEPVAFACPPDTQFVDHPTQPRCNREVSFSRCEPVVRPSVRCLEELDDLEGSQQGRSLKGGVCTAVPEPQPVCNPVASNESLPAERYCPNGGSLEGRRCVMREPIMPERVCRVGILDPITGQCTRETTAPVKTECPAGSIRKGTKCVAVEVVSPQFVCPPGSDMGANGVCVQYRDVITQAPKISRCPAVPRCLSGTLSGKECLQSFRQAVEMTCPAGSIDAGRQCLGTAELITPPPVEKTVRASLVCPPGSQLNGRVCVSTERLAAEECCPPGTMQEADGCHRIASAIVSEPRVQTQPAIPVCMPGASVRGTNCVRSIESPAMISCSNGFMLEGDRCVRTLEKTALCPAGTELQGSGCVRPVTVAPTIRIVNGCVNQVLRECETCPPQVRGECHNHGY